MDVPFPEHTEAAVAAAVPPTELAQTLTLIDCVAVQPFALVMVIVPL